MRVNGSALATIRERSGLTQSDLANTTGVSQGRISELEGATPAINARPGTVKKLADALGVPLMALIHHDPVEQAS